MKKTRHFRVYPFPTTGMWSILHGLTSHFHMYPTTSVTSSLVKNYHSTEMKLSAAHHKGEGEGLVYCYY